MSQSDFATCLMALHDKSVFHLLIAINFARISAQMGHSSLSRCQMLYGYISVSEGENRKSGLHNTQTDFMFN